MNLPPLANGGAAAHHSFMLVSQHSETELTLSDFHAPEMSVVPEHEGLAFSAMEMFVTSIGVCTAGVLNHYAQTIGVNSHDLTLHLRWQYAENPARIEHIEMDVEWPSLPPSRRAAAERAAATCPLHTTLHRSTAVATRVLIDTPVRGVPH